jgi:hypothetical protein
VYATILCNEKKFRRRISTDTRMHPIDNISTRFQDHGGYDLD